MPFHYLFLRAYVILLIVTINLSFLCHRFASLGCSHGGGHWPLLLLFLGVYEVFDGLDNVTRMVLIKQHFLLPCVEQLAGPRPVVLILDVPGATFDSIHIVFISELINVYSFHLILIGVVIEPVLRELDRCIAFHLSILRVELGDLGMSLAQFDILKLLC